MSEDIVSEVLALDARAEEVLSRARDEAARIRYEAAQRIDEERAALEKKIAGDTAAIREEAARDREAQTEKVREDFRREADAIRNVPPEALDGAVASVVSKAAGSAE